MVTTEEIKRCILAGLNCQHCEIKGDGSHFFVKVVSKSFENKNSLYRHRLIYQALGSRMDEEIHALSIEAFSPKEWDACAK